MVPIVWDHLEGFSLLTCVISINFRKLTVVDFSFGLQRNSISPAEREKYRARSPPEIDHKKVKKEEKDCHVSKIVIFGFASVYLKSEEALDTSKVLQGQ